jgi:xanthine dehydrogenase accessory factor
MGILAEAVELARARRPFVLASVLWRRGPSSGREGSQALILGDGTIRGWLGGACAEPTVVTEALACLADGAPRRLLLGSAEGEEAAPALLPDGVRTVPMACESEGAMEVHLEPNLPAPQVVVVGRSPAVDALAAMVEAIGWVPVILDDGGTADDHTRPDLVRTKLDLDGLVVDEATAVVVATQGHYDDLALEATLATAAGYVGLVASQARAEAVREHLRERGVAEHDLDRVVAPAGLDLGPLPNAEIAVAVLADLVRRRAAGGLTVAAARLDAGAEAVDPVCGMTVLIADAHYHLVHDGVDHYFCSPGCLRAFRADPSRYLT